MINKEFEAYKIKRELKRSGAEYKYKRLRLDSRNQVIIPYEYEEVVNIVGLYHEQNSNIQVVPSGEGAAFRTKKIPMILCEYDKVGDLRTDDVVIINNKTFKVTGTLNIQEWNIIADISLEVFDDGKR